MYERFLVRTESVLSFNAQLFQAYVLFFYKKNVESGYFNLYYRWERTVLRVCRRPDR